MKDWLLRPSRIPSAPSWGVVFFFGALYNALWVRCWWAAGLCLAVTIALQLWSRYNRSV